MPELRDEDTFGRARPEMRQAVAEGLARANVPCFACCGGVKPAHEPGCEADIRRRARSGRYDD